MKILNYSDSTIVGHGEIRRRLFHEYKGGKLHHTLLFIGQEGIGKKLVALELAACILERDKLSQLDHCPDFHYYNPLEESSQKGEAKEIRELLSTLSLRAFEGKARVILIDNAHHLGRAASNALLKSLEEPKLDTYFILISHNKERILPTVLSRCRIWGFSTLSEDEIQSILKAQDRTKDCSSEILGAGSLSELSLLESYNTEAIELRAVYKELEEGYTAPWFRFLRKYNNLRDRDFARFVIRMLQLITRQSLKKTAAERQALLLDNLMFMEHFITERNLSASLVLTVLVKAFAENVSLLPEILEEQIAL